MGEKVKEETIYFWVIIMLTFDDTHILRGRKKERSDEKNEREEERKVVP